ncbi:MAG: NifU family protein [Flavobacteriales bacterium]|nr:NifU family protein [Flavobacteriales bacterium]
MESGSLFERVNRSLEGIRPYLLADGGDITLVEITDDLTARVELHGACSGCSMSVMTMKAGVEQTIRTAVPEIRNVEAVNV